MSTSNRFVLARRDAVTLIATGTLIASVDQLTKFALTSMIGPGYGTPRLNLLANLVALEYTENRGAAFGLFQGLAPVFVLLTLAILFSLLLHYSRQLDPPRWQTLGVASIVGGAVGNLIDRVRLGYVVDFLSIGPWPNFNVADAAITIGVCVLLFGWLRSEAAWGSARTMN